MRQRGPRIDWHELRDRIDLAGVATALMGPAPGRRGERGRRLWWSCPFHADQNPSFTVYEGRWRCYGCDATGDAAALVMRLRSCTFSEAVRWLADFTAGGAAPLPKRAAPTKPASGPEGMTAVEADRLVAAASDRLWSRAGAAALDDLRRRGLDDETIRAARLGFDPRVQAMTRDGRPYQAGGIVIPWWEPHRDRVTRIKVRQREGRQPKYAEVYRDRPCLYVASPVLTGRPVIVTEGELDALLVAQQTGHLSCGVVTTGSASARPDRATVARLISAAPWIIATDADQAGDQAAAAWMELAPGRARRHRPPGPGKDWGDAHEAGFGRIAYDLAPVIMTPHAWESLSAWQWADPTDADEPPNILIDS